MPRPARARRAGSRELLLREARPIGAGPRFQPPATGPITGPCRPTLGPHYAVHLEVFAANRVVIVPTGIGTRRPRTGPAGRITHARCYSNLVTLDPTGVVLVRAGSRPTLAQLFPRLGATANQHAARLLPGADRYVRHRVPSTGTDPGGRQTASRSRPTPKSSSKPGRTYHRTAPTPSRPARDLLRPEQDRRHHYQAGLSAAPGHAPARPPAGRFPPCPPAATERGQLRSTDRLRSPALPRHAALFPGSRGKGASAAAPAGFSVVGAATFLRSAPSGVGNQWCGRRVPTGGRAGSARDRMRGNQSSGAGERHDRSEAYERSPVGGVSDRPPPTRDLKGRDARRASPGSRRAAPSRPTTAGRARSPVARSDPPRRSPRSGRNRLDRSPVRARPPGA